MRHPRSIDSKIEERLKSSVCHLKAVTVAAAQYYERTRQHSLLACKSGTAEGCERLTPQRTSPMTERVIKYSVVARAALQSKRSRIWAQI